MRAIMTVTGKDHDWNRSKRIGGIGASGRNCLGYLTDHHGGILHHDFDGRIE